MSTFGNSLSLRVDGAIGAMSLSPNGRDAVLAGRRGLFIIDLDDPFMTPRWLHHVTLWEVADVQWSPHNQKPSWCISTSNQKALLWDLSRPSNSAILNVLHSHTRAITDINFHPQHPEVIATCSVDTFIYSWDMRTPRKPVAQWADWRAGAIQVKWNHEDPNQLASSHDNCFYVWDLRKGSTPLIKVNNAHSRKINGLDFSQGLSNIITSSNDHSVKMWNLESAAANEVISKFNYFDTTTTLQPSVVIHTDFPVSRARHIPFGNAKACGIMPLRGGGDAIHVVNYEAAYSKSLHGETVHVYKDRNEGLQGDEDHSLHQNSQIDTASQGELTLGEITVGEPHRNGESLYEERPHFQIFADNGATRNHAITSDYIHTFKGHKAPMKDFLWRTNQESKYKYKDYQLVTWSSQDYDLKLWPHDENLYAKVNFNPYLKILFNRGLESIYPDDEIFGDVASIKSIEPEAFTYNTYCIEPPILLHDLEKQSNGDILSSMTLYQIAERKRNSGGLNLQNQINHLDWISGVRMGRSNTAAPSDENEPTNFGEEVSIVGHKFPKVRFEKISVSTGELVVSLRGPLPNVEDENADADKERSDKNLTKESIGDEEPEQDQRLIFIRILITFPKSYPYCDEIADMPRLTKKLARLQKHNLINFDIEITHELSTAVKAEMLKNLNEIAQFYTNKYKKFCLEPCLRYLIGDKVELVEELMVEKNEVVEEVGNEGWADDLINQQPLEIEMKDDSSGEEDDLIPALTNPATRSETPIEEPKRTFFDSTPVPKGCGAAWSPTGQLVCFFLPLEEEEKTLQKFNMYQFTDGGVKQHQHTESESEDMSDSEDSSSISDFSITNDLDEVFEGARKLPGFQGSGFQNEKSRLASGGTPSNYKSLLPDKKKRNEKSKNIVSIFDLRHLLPDKYELGSEYRVLGDSPENLARYNSGVALKYGLQEISDVWKILEMILIKDVIIEDINPTYYQDPETFTNMLTELKHLKRKNYRFYWGTHPIGHSWLITEIFRYFERRGNIQMLAMLSCILYENPINLKKDPSDGKSPIDFSVPIQTPYQVLPVRRPSERPVDEADHLLSHRSLLVFRRDQISTGLSLYAKSATSSIGSFKEQISLPERFKKILPGSFLTSNDYILSNDAFREKNLKFRTKLTVVEKRKLTKAVQPSKGRNMLRPIPTVSIDMQNTDELDLYDDLYTLSLLQSQDSLKIKLYREQYANMLYMWGLHLDRIKILKFNFPTTVKSSSIVHSVNFGMRSRKKQSHTQLFINAVTLIPGNNAWNTTKRSQFKYCVFCNLVVLKNMVLCTNCEHVLHTDCASEWWRKGGDDECASGCGCNCLEHVI